jgi:dolichol kinase
MPNLGAVAAAAALPATHSAAIVMLRCLIFMSWLLEFPYCTRLNGSVGKGYASYFVMAERLCTDFVSPAQDRLLRFVSPGGGPAASSHRRNTA